MLLVQNCRKQLRSRASAWGVAGSSLRELSHLGKMEASEAATRQQADTAGDGPEPVQTDLLFQPYRIGKHTLKHRIVYAPLTRCRALDPGYVPGDNMLEYYSQRARGCEGGLIIAEATVISNTGHGYDAQRF